MTGSPTSAPPPLLREIPLALRHDVYALAALAEGLVMVAGDRWGLPAGPVAAVGSVVVVVIRVLAIWRRRNAPPTPDADAGYVV
ncbi:hypothetical protein GCM10018793_51090 [Streptomyces sulfonofaciens]|uniref:Uncharacterized protein n=1 Tax=Streptomyces sulfonofaciens TaxID=68272 RepID=A0A919GJ64_9ACTN|nr:hypothetical protein GCM10018793_51090 [Streptomyces sulfonofaciens]